MVWGLLDMALAPLLEIQVWGFGRTPVHLDLRRCLHSRVDHRRAMGVEPVPHDEERTRHVSPEGMEGGHEIRSAASLSTVSRVGTAGQGQPDHRGTYTAGAHVSQDRGWPRRSPRGHGLRPAGEAGSINAPELRLSAASLWFS